MVLGHRVPAGGSLRDLLDRGSLLEPSQALVVGLEARGARPGPSTRHRPPRDHAVEAGVRRGSPAAGRRLRGWPNCGRGGVERPGQRAAHVARYASPEQALGHGGRREDRRVRAVAVVDRESVTGRCRSPAIPRCRHSPVRVGKLMPVSADLGSLAAVLESVPVVPTVEDRSTAAEFGRGWSGRGDPASARADPADRYGPVHHGPRSPARRSHRWPRAADDRASGAR